MLAVEAIVLLVVADRLRRRRVLGKYAQAWAGYVIWWVGSAVAALVSLTRHVNVAMGGRSPSDDLGLMLLASWFGAVAAAGLMVFLLTMVNGARRWHSLAYPAALLVFLVTSASVVAAGPAAVVARGGSVVLLFSGDPSMWAMAPMVLGVFLPLGLLAVLAFQAGFAPEETRWKTQRLAFFASLWIVTRALVELGSWAGLGATAQWAIRGAGLMGLLGMYQAQIMPRERPLAVGTA